MSEETETPKSADVAGRLDGLVSATLLGTTSAVSASGSITAEEIRNTLRRMSVSPAPPIPRIIESLLMADDGEPYEVPRTWKERLLTRPWRPLKTTRMVVPKIPKKDAMRFRDGTLVMHPVTAAKLRAVLYANAAVKPRRHDA